MFALPKYFKNSSCCRRRRRRETNIILFSHHIYQKHQKICSHCSDYGQDGLDHDEMGDVVKVATAQSRQTSAFFSAVTILILCRVHISAETTQHTLMKTRSPTHPPLILDGCRFREFSTPRWTAPLTQVHPPGARRTGGFGLLFFWLAPPWRSMLSPWHVF